MALLQHDVLDPAANPPRRSRAALVPAAALASIGAGAVHAAAAGAHGEHPALAKVFVALAVTQVAAGVLALRRPARGTLVGTAVLNAGAVAGWALSRFVGISWIDGLAVAERPQTADTVCAVLGALAVVAATRAWIGGDRSTPRAGGFALPALVVTALAVPALATTGGHVHAAGHDHYATAAAATPGGSNAAATAGSTAGSVSATTGHAHTDDTGAATTVHGHGAAATETTAAGGAGDGGAPAGGTTGGAGASPAPVAAPVPYDPTKPIDLGGIPGVTPEQQAAAENLVAVTLVRLPKWADPKVAEAAGFHSIGDAVTGHEHYLNWDWLDDGVILDPDKPESLVYEPQPDGSKKLVSAMFMLSPDKTLADVPDIGGSLMQWHVHDNLCFAAGLPARVAGLTNAAGECPTGLVKGPLAPMIHVWITPNPCGPFAALEGVGAGQIKPGETRLCDTAHGGHA